MKQARGLDSARAVVACPLCGRGIFDDHNLADRNFDKHVAACPQQQAEAAQRAAKKLQRAYEKQVKKAGFGTVPMIGQLGFEGWLGVPKVFGG